MQKSIGFFFIKALVIFCVVPISAEDCSTVKADTTTVTLSFGYKKSDVFSPIQFESRDSAYYQQIGRSVATSEHNLNDDSLGPNPTKKSILDQIAKASAGKKYVNFNYVGHGVRLANGEWALPLPTMPEDLFVACGKSALLELSHNKLTNQLNTGGESSPESSCLGGSDKSCACLRGANRMCVNTESSSCERGANRKCIERTRGANRMAYTKAGSGKSSKIDCNRFKDFVLTSSELHSAFGERKVFGFIDSCHSGSVNFGPNSLMINSSQGNETSSDELSLVNHFMTSRQRCQSHTDADGAINLTSLATKFPFEEKDADGIQGIEAHAFHASGFKTYESRLSTQTPTRTGARKADWAKCMKIVLPYNPCGTQGASEPRTTN